MRVLSMPRLFGPTSFMPPAAQRRASSVCIARPAAPVSANPEENITAAFTPFTMQSSMACIAALAGTAMIA